MYMIIDMYLNGKICCVLLLRNRKNDIWTVIYFYTTKYTINLLSMKPLRGSSVAEWFESLESLAPFRCWFEPLQGIWFLSCEEAIKPAYGTPVVLLRPQMPAPT